MSLRARFTLVFLLLVGGLLAALGIIGKFQHAQWRDLAHSEQAERRIFLRELVTLRAESSRHFVEDYGQWDECVAFVKNPTPKWSGENLDASLPSFRLDRLWIFRPDASLVYAVAVAAGSPPPPPLPAPVLRRLFTQPGFSFFYRDSDALFEIHGASIVPTTDPARVASPTGFILVAQRWDHTTLARLAPIAQGTLGLRAPDQPPPPGSDTTSIPLLDHEGKTTAHLSLQFSLPEASVVETTDAYELIAAALIGITGLVVLGFSLQLWILQPLARISESLATNEHSPLLPLVQDRSELGRLAALVHHSQNQQALLRQAHDERARLSRDLHDGAIQAIYATGLSLASARTLLHSAPAEAEVVLERARNNLNDVIRDLRSSLTGLEPPAEPDRKFSQILAGILALAPTSLTVVSAVDDSLAARLTLAQRAQLLPIIREALSNAARHAHARTLRVTLRAEGPGVLLEIADDGLGFDPTQPPLGGRGLANLAARARDLSATFSVHSTPGAGTTVSLQLPPLA